MATFASAEDIAGRVGRPLTDGETTQVAILLELATSLVAEAAGQGQEWADARVADASSSPTYRLICIEAVLRGLQNPAGVESQTETLGAYSHTERYAVASTVGMLLTESEERRIRRAAYGTNTVAVQAPSILGDCPATC